MVRDGWLTGGGGGSSLRSAAGERAAPEPPDMAASPYTRLLFAHLLPGASFACAILFLLDVPVEDGYRISLLEWSMDSDRVFPYLAAVGLVASAVLGAVIQAARTLLLDPWVLRCPAAAAAARRSIPGPAALATDLAVPAADAAPPADPGPGAQPFGPRAAGPRATPGPLAEFHGNLAISMLLAVLWIAAKILRGGGTEVFPRRIAYGVPLVGLAACALLFFAYRSGGDPGPA